MLCVTMRREEERREEERRGEGRKSSVEESLWSSVEEC